MERVLEPCFLECSVPSSIKFSYITTECTFQRVILPVLLGLVTDSSSGTLLESVTYIIVILLVVYSFIANKFDL